MAAGSKVAKLPVKRVRPAPKPARRAPRKAAAPKASKAPEKTSGFAVGVSQQHYEWITATAAALGKSRQSVVDGIIGKLLHRATLGGTRRARR